MTQTIREELSPHKLLVNKMQHNLEGKTYYLRNASRDVVVRQACGALGIGLPELNSD